jgi:hypothetical protein
LDRVQGRIIGIIRQWKIWHPSALVELYVIMNNIHVNWQLHFTVAEKIEIGTEMLVNKSQGFFCLLRMKITLVISKISGSHIW